MKETLGTRLLQDSKQKNHQKKAVDVEVPGWLKVMYNTVYFEACTIHPDEKEDHFCIDCLLSFCPNCLLIHNLHLNAHKIVKIRRYVYCEVIRRQDLSKHFNCSGIQAYQTNKSKVLFLKQRTQQQQPQQQNNISSNNSNSCIICQRSLQDLSLYCSIECKVFALCGGESMEVKDESLNKRTSFKRQRSRKGVPLRAPMF